MPVPHLSCAAAFRLVFDHALQLYWQRDMHSMLFLAECIEHDIELIALWLAGIEDQRGMTFDRADQRPAQLGFDPRSIAQGFERGDALFQ